MDDIFRGLGVEDELTAPENFGRVRETLQRMGIASSRERKLHQSCHLLHKRGRYSILSFKEVFVMDGRTGDISEEDLARRNRIALLLEEWGLVRVLDPEAIADKLAPMSALKVISYRERADWTLVPKHSLGSRTAERGLGKEEHGTDR